LQELTDLAPADRGTLMEEIAAASRALHAVARPDKINVGALGNIVAQLHVHVVARRRGDAAWPGPVWGAGAPEPYDDDGRARLFDALNAALPDLVQAK
jgi:diadenosine tetraphosphate (Ap4A) HIT family hydrolase